MNRVNETYGKECNIPTHALSEFPKRREKEA